MVAYNSFNYPFEYSDEDYYIRAVRHNMIRKNGDIKRSAFRSNNGGVSVTRTNEELKEYAYVYMTGHIVTTAWFIWDYAVVLLYRSCVRVIGIIFDLVYKKSKNSEYRIFPFCVLKI